MGQTDKLHAGNKIVIFLFLSLVTVICHTYIKRYEKNGSEMLRNNWKVYMSKNKNQKKGHVNNEKALIRDRELYLFSADKNKSITVRQNIPSFVHGSVLELSADMKCRNVVAGKKSWNLARLLLVQNDGHKNRWDRPNLVAALKGTKDWQRYEEVFFIEYDVKKLKVTAQLSQCTGSFYLKNIRLFPVIQTKVYTWIKRIILISWAVFAFFLIAACIVHNKKTAEHSCKSNIIGGNQEVAAYYVSKKNMGLQIMLVLSFIAIIIGTAMPGDIKAQVLKEVSSKINISHFLPWNISQVGHFCFFALFGFILSMLTGRDLFMQSALNILLIAGGTELAQSFIDGRTPLFVDFFIDSAGGLIGIVLFWMWMVMYDLWCVRRHKVEL